MFWFCNVIQKGYKYKFFNNQQSIDVFFLTCRKLIIVFGCMLKKINKAQMIFVVTFFPASRAQTLITKRVTTQVSRCTRGTRGTRGTPPTPRPPRAVWLNQCRQHPRLIQPWSTVEQPPWSYIWTWSLKEPGTLTRGPPGEKNGSKCSWGTREVPVRTWDVCFDGCMDNKGNSQVQIIQRDLKYIGWNGKGLLSTTWQ